MTFRILPKATHSDAAADVSDVSDVAAENYINQI